MPQRTRIAVFSLLLLLLAVFTVEGIGVSFSYLLPRNGMFSHPVPPLSVRDIGIDIGSFLGVAAKFGNTPWQLRFFSVSQVAQVEASRAFHARILGISAGRSRAPEADSLTAGATICRAPGSLTDQRHAHAGYRVAGPNLQMPVVLSSLCVRIEKF